MFAASHDEVLRNRSTPQPTDDHTSIRERARRLFHRDVHVSTLSSQSLAITTSSSHHDDLPTPSAPTHALPTASEHSTPMTSPSTGYSSLFPGSLSSATSESAPSAEFRSDFGLLTSGSSPVYGSSSSRSSRPVSPRSRSTTDSPVHPSPSHFPPNHSPHPSSNCPSTAPHSPRLVAITTDLPGTPVEHHTRSHSRFSASIKNFLSRPAASSPSRRSFSPSITTPDSERVPTATGRWSMPRKSRPSNLEMSGTVAAALPSPSRGSSQPPDAHRRYASEAAAKIYNTRIGNDTPMSQEGLDLSPQNSLGSRAREGRTRNVLRRRPSGSAKVFKSRERGMSSPSRPNKDDDADLGDASHLADLSSPLTPAGAVVEAYKHQGLRGDHRPSLSKLSIDGSLRASRDGEPKQSPKPYYTIFGSPSDRHVQAGGPDDRWAMFEADQIVWNTSRPTLSHQPSASYSSNRGLTRKVSNKWRSVRAGGVTSEDSPARDKAHSKGRPSLQELWGSGTRSTGRSMDGNPGDGAWSSPGSGHVRSGSDKEGGKIWRLMRRISTGGLRDRFSSDKAVPPVPAIPKEHLGKANQSERSNEPVSLPRHKPSSSLYDKDRTTPSKNTRPSVAMASSSSNSSEVASTQFFYRSHSARSSVSSYGEAVAASRMLEVTLDQRIIAPSEQLRLGEDHGARPDQSSAPMPRSPRRSASVPAGLNTVSMEDAEIKPVPLPSPRRRTCSGEAPICIASKPSTPSGNAYASHETRQSRRADGIVSLSPPPRSAKSSRRGGSTASSPAHPVLAKPMDGVGIGIRSARRMDRTSSGQSDITARADSPAPTRRPRNPDILVPTPTRTGLTFRELGASRRPPLSEREKADIWNELLDRSDKAGGTLHINGATELMSDTMRFSTHSELA